MLLNMTLQVARHYGNKRVDFDPSIRVRATPSLLDREYPSPISKLLSYYACCKVLSVTAALIRGDLTEHHWQGGNQQMSERWKALGATLTAKDNHHAISFSVDETEEQEGEESGAVKVKKEGVEGEQKVSMGVASDVQIEISTDADAPPVVEEPVVVKEESERGW
jgi:hypothetical protein